MDLVHACRKCHCEYPATEESFYRAGRHFNWICKSCMKAAVAAQKRKRHQRIELARTCDYCGGPFVVIESLTRKRPKRFCTYRCHLDHRQAEAKRQRLASKPERWCLHCGIQLPRTMTLRAVYCSARCNSHAHQLVRKLAGRAGTERRSMSRAALGERDGWRCQICGKAVSRDLEYPDPLAPSVDHLLPLALGGMNELANLQLTHLRCNLRKRHCVGDLQLRLVG